MKNVMRGKPLIQRIRHCLALSPLLCRHYSSSCAQLTFALPLPHHKGRLITPLKHIDKFCFSLAVGFVISQSAKRIVV